AEEQVERVLRQEEERFRETLEQGIKLLDEALGNLKGETIPGEVVFKLYDTYGFPVDLTNDIARERGLSLDMAGFEREMEAQRERARSASQFKSEYIAAGAVAGRSEFTGYEQLEDQGKIIGLYRDGRSVSALEAGERGMVVLERTPFYAE